jgi:hypothetical protein
MYLHLVMTGSNYFLEVCLPLLFKEKPFLKYPMTAYVGTEIRNVEGEKQVVKGENCS